MPGGARFPGSPTRRLIFLGSGLAPTGRSLSRGPGTPPSGTLLLRGAKGGSTAYGEEIGNYPGQFDVLVIDGRDRVNCARHGLAALRPGGVVIWDNSDRQEYLEGYRLLAAAGFRRLDFWGPGPLATRRWCTSIFYREGNCLGI